MKIRNLVLGALLTLVFSFSATAQTQSPKINKTQIKQTKRIKHGVKNGELTRPETKRLVQQQKRLQKTKKAAKADGVLTKKERVRLNAAQKRTSANIYRSKHNQN